MTNQNTAPTAINNGRVIDPANGIDRITSVFLADGRIAAVGDQPPAGFGAAQRGHFVFVLPCQPRHIGQLALQHRGPWVAFAGVKPQARPDFKGTVRAVVLHEHQARKI